MTTKPIPVPIGEWLPDLADLGKTGATEAKNCIPGVDSYGEMRALSEFSNALDSEVIGAIWLQDRQNTFYNFAGSKGTGSGDSALYQLNANLQWSDVSKVGGYTSFKDWEFAKFGPRVIATNNNDPVQFFDLEGVSSTFADLAGSPPKAQRIAVVRDFVVLGDLLEYEPATIAWGGFNASELWTPSQATQSDRQELFGRGGRIQRIIPGDYGVIIREHSIHRMDYVGPPIIFQLDEVESGRGTPAPNSVVQAGNLLFYYGHDGYYLFNGQASEPIGANRIDKWFRANADATSLDKMRAVIDRRNKLVLWAFRTSSSLAYNDRVLAYNWGSNRYSYGEVNTECLAEFITSGFSLDTLDTPLPGGIDIDSIRVDSTAYLGGALGLQAFTPNHKSADFAGDPLTAIIDTTETASRDGGVLYTNSVRPVVQGDPSTVVRVAIGSRGLQNDNVDWTALRATNLIGEANIRKTSRYQRYRLEIAGGFEHAQGVDVYTRPRTGRR